MADLTIPQTKQAQKWVDYRGVTPSYIFEMDKLAGQAHLDRRLMTNSRRQNNGSVILAYSGTKQQIRNCKLLLNPESIGWPNGAKNCTKHSIIAMSWFGTWGGYPHNANIHKINDTRYALVVTEQKPTVAHAWDNGIEHFEYGVAPWSCHAFSGTRDALIESGIVAASEFPDDSTDEGLETTEVRRTENIGGVYTAATLTELRRLYGEKWVFVSHPEAIRQYEELQEGKRQERLSPYASPDKWLESYEDLVTHMARVVLGKEAHSIETQGGMRFTADSKELADILAEIETAAQRIREVRVTCEAISKRPACAGSREQAAAASMDGKFQSFMRSSMMKPQDDGRTH